MMTISLLRNCFFFIVWSKVKQAFVRDPDGYYLEFCRSFTKLTQDQIFSTTIFLLLKRSEFCPSFNVFHFSCKVLENYLVQAQGEKKQLNKNKSWLMCSMYTISDSKINFIVRTKNNNILFLFLMKGEYESVLRADQRKTTDEDVK